MNDYKIPSKLTIKLGNIKKQIAFNHLILLVLITCLIVVGFLPSLIAGRWSWMDIPKITNVGRARELRAEGLDLQPWVTLAHREIELGKGKWSAQTLQRGDERPIVLLLKPQVYYKDRPEVEWSDVRSLNHWKTADEGYINFLTPDKKPVTARFFRAWNRNTLAVVEWYAWLGGGNPDPAVWYWLDQKAQLKHNRVAWIAVSLHIPLEPLKELQSVKPLAIELATKIQAGLEKTVWSDPEPARNVKKDK